jgi:hypothetical protein
VGKHSITASYAGDADSAPSVSAKLNQTVKRGATTVNLVSSSGSWLTGQPVTFTATVIPKVAGAGTPTGSVTFMDNGKAMPLGIVTLLNGQATFTASLTAGTQTITVSYSGDGNFSAASVKMTQKVAKSLATVKTPLSGLGSAQARKLASPFRSSATSRLNDAALLDATCEQE